MVLHACSGNGSSSRSNHRSTRRSDREKKYSRDLADPIFGFLFDSQDRLEGIERKGDSLPPIEGNSPIDRIYARACVCVCVCVCISLWRISYTDILDVDQRIAIIFGQLILARGKQIRLILVAWIEESN
jgi:hypothetical protein